MKRTMVAFCAALMMATVAAAAQKPKTVTLTGCVKSSERNTFVLTKVEGNDAPKARGWKTGYLLKRPAHVDVVPAASSVRLREHVGRRVSVTGTLERKERSQLRARSIRVLSSCA